VLFRVLYFEYEVSKARISQPNIYIMCSVGVRSTPVGCTRKPTFVDEITSASGCHHKYLSRKIDNPVRQPASSCLQEFSRFYWWLRGDEVTHF
jgi:hypothetical protein